MSNAPSMPECMPQECPSAMHATYETQLTRRIPDPGGNPRVPDPAGATDSGSPLAWFDRELTPQRGRVLIARTKTVLDRMNAEQEALGRMLDATGLTNFADRADWLIAHRNPLDALAGELRAAHLTGWRASHDHLGVHARPRRMPRPRFTDRQLEIAMRALDHQKEDAA